jgi:hypothetical protein
MKKLLYIFVLLLLPVYGYPSIVALSSHSGTGGPDANPLYLVQSATVPTNGTTPSIKFNRSGKYGAGGIDDFELTVGVTAHDLLLYDGEFTNEHYFFIGDSVNCAVIPDANVNQNPDNTDAYWAQTRLTSISAEGGLIADAVEGAHYISKTGLLSAATKYFFSAKLKAGTEANSVDFARLMFYDDDEYRYVYFDLSNGVVETETNNNDAGISTVDADGYYRCWMTATITTVTSNNSVYVMAAEADGDASFQGDTSDVSIYVKDINLMPVWDDTVDIDEVCTLDYDQPGDGAEALTGTDLSSVVADAVNNNSIHGDATPPEIVSITLTATNAAVLYNETVQIGTGGNGGAALTMDVEGDVSPTYASLSDRTINYTISEIAAGSVAADGWDYTQPGDGVEDLAGNDAANEDDFPVINTVAGSNPILVSMTLGSDGYTWTQVYSESVTVGAGGSAGYTLEMTNAGSVPLTYSSGSPSTTLVYTSTTEVYNNDTIADGLDYTQPGNGIEATDDGTDVTSYTDFGVITSGGPADPGEPAPSQILYCKQGGDGSNASQSGPFISAPISADQAMSAAQFNNANNWGGVVRTDGLVIGPDTKIYFIGTFTSDLEVQGSGHATYGDIILDGYEAGDCDHSSGEPDANAAVINSDAYSAGIAINGQDYVTIRDFTINDAGNGIYQYSRSGVDEAEHITISRVATDGCTNGIRFTFASGYAPSGDYVTIQDCLVVDTAVGYSDSAKAGLRIYQVDDLIIQRNLIYQRPAVTTLNNGQDGIVLLYCDNVLIQNNKIYHVGENCIDYKNDTNELAFGGIIIRYNDFSGAREAAIQLMHETGSQAYVYGNRFRGGADQAELFSYAVDVYRGFEEACIWANDIADTSRAGVMVFNDGARTVTDVWIANNTIVNSNYGSTSTSSEHAGIEILSAKAGDIHMANNILVDNNTTEDYDTQIYTSAGVASWVDAWNNLYWLSSGTPKIEWSDVVYSTIAAWQTATGQGTDAVTTTPDFTDLSGRDLTIGASSNAINAADDLDAPSWWSPPTIQGTDYSATITHSLVINTVGTDFDAVPPVVVMVEQDAGADGEIGCYAY